MVINHNMASLYTLRQLNVNSSNAQKNIEKLSSGMRINRAGDDAAGLAISEKMRGQISGLNQASRNSQDAISLIQTAEGALNETHSILQRMRELAVQASNDTNTSDDRDQIQKEMTQLTSEINRIGNTTEFNTMKLLNGDKSISTTSSSIVNKTSACYLLTCVTALACGTGGCLTVNKSLGMTLPTCAAQATAWQNAISNGICLADDTSADEKITWSAVDLADSCGTVQLGRTACGDLTITLNAFDAGTCDQFSYTTTFSKCAMAAAATCGVYNVNFHGVTFDLNVANFACAGTSCVTLDLTGAKPACASVDATGTYGLKNDFICGASCFTKFTIDGSNAALAGICSIQVCLAGGNVLTVRGFNGATAVLCDTITLACALCTGGTSSFEYDENGIDFAFTIIQDASCTDITDFSTKKFDVSNMVAAPKTTITCTLKTAASCSTTTNICTIDNSLKMQIGANIGQQMSIDVSDMRSVALGISSCNAGCAVCVTDSMGKALKAYFVCTTNVNNGTDNNSNEYSLDLSTSDKATAAISVIDQATSKVSDQRSKLGAFQNRLEHTINNLGTASENLTASESRVRDVDMAKEMTEFTKNNILSQAAQAMLAQANQQPQGVLQLLR